MSVERSSGESAPALSVFLSLAHEIFRSLGVGMFFSFFSHLFGLLLGCFKPCFRPFPLVRFLA